MPLKWLLAHYPYAYKAIYSIDERINDIVIL